MRSKLLRWIAVMLLAASGVARAMPADQDRFTAQAAEMLAAAVPDMRVVVKGPLSLNVTPRGTQAANTGTVQVNLDRSWQTCRRNQSGCDGFVAQYIADTVSTLRQREEHPTRDAIRAVLRPGNYLASLDPSGDPVKQTLARPFPGGMLLMCVVDSPRSVRSLSRDDLTIMGLDATGAFDLAVRNMKGELSSSRGLDISTTGVVNALHGGFFESSRLLLLDQWSAVASRFGGRLIAAAPSNDTILFADARRPGTVADLRASARRLEQQTQRPLSHAVLEWTPGGWRELAE